MESIDQVLSLCGHIYTMVENMKANKERCQRLAKRVKALEELVLPIKQRGAVQISGTVENALKELIVTLTSANSVMAKYSKSTGFKSFVKSGSHEEMFSQVNERLNEDFQMLSGALQVEQSTVLYKVFESVSGRRMSEVDHSGQTLSSPTALNPLPAARMPPPLPATAPLRPPPIGILGSTASMPPPNPVTTHPASMPSNPALPSPPLSMPAPLPVTMHGAALPPNIPMSPTSQMPSPVFSPTTPIPRGGPVFHPPNPAPVRTIISPQQVYRPVSSNIVTHTVVSNTIAPRPVMMSPVQAPGTIYVSRSPAIRYVINNNPR